MPNIISTNKSKQRLIIIFSLLTTNLIFSQKIYNYNSPGANCYSEYIFKENAINPKGVIVVDVKGEDLKNYSQSNSYIDSGFFTDYNFLYIKLLNKEDVLSLSCYEVVINTVSYVHRIEESVFFLIYESGQTEHITPFLIKNNSYHFNIVDNNQDNLKILKSELDTLLINQNYGKPKAYTSEEIQAVKMSNYKQNFDVGFFCSPFVLFGQKLNTTSDVMATYGLSFKKSVGNKTAFIINLSIGTKKPDKNAIMEQVQSNEKGIISSYALFGGEFMFRYFNNPDKPLRLFSSVGFGMYSMTNIRIKIKSSGVSAKSNENSYYTPTLDMGLEYRLSPVLKVNSSIPLRYYINQSDNSANTFSMGLNLGFTVTLNPNTIGKSGKKSN